MRKTLGKVTNCFIAEEFLTQIENLFLSTYKSEIKSDAGENENEWLSKGIASVKL